MNREISTNDFSKGVNLDDFEFMNVGSIDAHYPQVISFRERVPRLGPDGKLHRVYCLVDGSVRFAVEDDASQFVEFEKQYAPPQPSQ